jgi:cytidylate kinase
VQDKPRTAITIARQMGSGGTYVGYLLAKELGFKYVDREILLEAGKRLGTDAGWLERFDGKSSGLLATILRGFCYGPPETAYVPPFRMPVYDRELYSVESGIMREIASRHDAVFVGRAGFHALKGHPCLISIFMHAPLEFRIGRLMKVQGITGPREAGSMVEESDAQRARFVREVVGETWTDARNYDLCFDTSVVSFTAAVELICGLVREKRAACPG